MGVSFYTCEACNRTFPDCRAHFQCYSCSSLFCSDECGGKQVYRESPPEYEELTNCIFCRMEVVTDRDLLQFALKRLNLTRDQAVELYRGEQRNLSG